MWRGGGVEDGHQVGGVDCGEAGVAALVAHGGGDGDDSEEKVVVMAVLVGGGRVYVWARRASMGSWCDD